LVHFVVILISRDRREEHLLRDDIQNSCFCGTVSSDGIRSVYSPHCHLNVYSVSPCKFNSSQFQGLDLCCSRRAISGTTEVQVALIVVYSRVLTRWFSRMGLKRFINFVVYVHTTIKFTSSLKG
jgi:hypothetical protein